MTSTTEADDKFFPKLFEFTMCTIFFWGGAGVVTPSKSLFPPTNNLCLYPPPVLRCFWKDPLMTHHSHHPISSIFHCYKALPIHHPFKILIIHYFGCDCLNFKKENILTMFSGLITKS